MGIFLLFTWGDVEQMKVFPPSWQLKRNKPNKATCSLENRYQDFQNAAVSAMLLLVCEGIC